MGIQKAIVAFVIAGIGLANAAFAIDFNVDENLVNTVVGLAVTVGAGLGVWAIPNSTSTTDTTE